MRQIYKHVAAGEVDEATDVLFDCVDDMLIEGCFAKCDAWIQRIDLKKLDTNLLVGLLSITYVARHHLESRAELVLRVEKRLIELAPDRAESLMRGRR
jgi:hypothetical protein